VLLSSRADPSARDAKRRVPVDLPGSAECRSLLTGTALRANVSALRRAACERRFDAVLAMLQRHWFPLDIRCSPTSDYCLVHQASLEDSLRVYKALVSRGASPLLRTRRGNHLPSALARMRGAETAAAEMERYERRARFQLAHRPLPPPPPPPPPGPPPKPPSEAESDSTVYFPLER